MLETLKNLARSILALPYDAGIFLEKTPDTIEKWQWCRQYKATTLVAFYSQKCLLSEMFLRTAITLEPDLRNFATMVWLPDHVEGARDLMRQLGVESLPRLVLTDREGRVLRTWGTTLYPIEVMQQAEKASKLSAAV